MTKRFFALLCAAALLFSLCACNSGSTQTDSESVTVYYTGNSGYAAGGGFVESVELQMPDGDDKIHYALDRLGEEPDKDGLASALVKGTRIYSYSLDDGVISVELSPAYLGLTELEQTAVKSCVTLTLCAIDEIDSVNIYVDGSPVEESLDADSIILEDTDTNEFEKRILLYFPETGGKYLSPEYRVLTVGQDKLLAEYVVEELISSTQSSELTGAVPEGTRLISISLKSGVCTVNFSGEFVENRADTAAGQRMTVYSVVNSLTHLDGIDKVRFQVDGAESRAYEYIDLSGSFSGYGDFVYGAQNAYDGFETVYLGVRELDRLIPAQVFIKRDSALTAEENTVNYILSMTSVSGYSLPVPQAVKLNSIETINRRCRIDLSENLFSNGAGAVAQRAAYAIAYAVIDTKNVDFVTISVNGRLFLENIVKDGRNIVE